MNISKILIAIVCFIVALPNNCFSQLDKGFDLRKYDRAAMEAYKNDPSFNTDLNVYKPPKLNDELQEATIEEDKEDKNNTTDNDRGQPDEIVPDYDKIEEVTENDDSYGNQQRGSRSKPERSSRNSESTINTLPTGRSLNFNWIWVVLAGAGIFLLVAYFMGLKPNVFKKLQNDGMVEADGEQDINEIAFESELDKALKAGDYKTAVRILYLESLKTLNDKQMIQWQKNKTNWDYLYELKTNNETLRADFKQVTYIFDYVWYGDFEMDKQKFDVAKTYFDDFKKIV